MKEVSLVFPHQLFEVSELVELGGTIYLVEEYLFFSQYHFHKQKLAYHRASMKSYEAYLQSQNASVQYIEATDNEHDIRLLLQRFKKEGVERIHVYEVTDDWLNQRLEESGITLMKYTSPLFLNEEAKLATFFRPNAKKIFQTKFYIQQRKRLNILIEEEDKPVGGKWSYDAENRKKYPRGKIPPAEPETPVSQYWEEATIYVKKHFPNNPGLLDAQLYPVNHQESRQWLVHFLKDRFVEFGPYEDAIVAHQTFLHHSVLTPMLNIGLLTPQFIIKETLAYTRSNKIPLNSLEGFLRQIIGWREFIRGVYWAKGREERTRNFWGFNRKIPAAFYDGTTGIVPLDNTIKKVLDKAYCHHIERLMILGNFMLLCEFDPDEVYIWFMELFIDAYDWVMVPNVYGMSQFADGGLMSTKPYISGSNYLMKMSNYKKGEWQSIWDGLFWRFMHVHRDFFLKNPRLSMLVRMYDKMPEEKQAKHLLAGNNFLAKLDQSTIQ